MTNPTGPHPFTCHGEPQLCLRKAEELIDDEDPVNVSFCPERVPHRCRDSRDKINETHSNAKHHNKNYTTNVRTKK